MTKSRECGGFIWAEEPQKFLEIAEEKGWQEALISVQQENSPDKLQEALAPNRLAWLNLVDIKPSTKALDIGAGSGGIACQLAKKCNVVAIDGSDVDVEFLKIRAKQESLRNFKVIMANALNLPFDRNHFDLAIMNGVLEWIPTSQPDRNPRDAQLKSLKEVRRVLKTTGNFLLGIENRYYLGYFLGVPEQHVNLKYVSIMDRGDAEQLSQNVRSLPFLEYTYTRWEYENLIREAGFKYIEAYWLFPDYRLPQYIIPLNSQNAIKFFVDELLRPEDYGRGILYSIYQFYKFCDPKIIGEFVGHFGFLCR
ncbi:class I SAM-dependent methyltransferase [Candidatus Gottesmanbacteria bacterium]|nr:class I SAM-dependent methyltransferase [Candidatus Gottesmanbacteria bacterium]